MTAPHRPELLVEGVPADDRRLAELRRDPALVIVDELAGQRAELARVRPAIGADLDREAPRWVHYPWRRTLVHVLGPASFRRLRLDRNRNKITLAEQERFDRLRVGVVGLSVGHAVAHTLALEGLVGQLRLADFDDIELSNLNRVPASLLDLGVNKAVVAARRIAELDPYLDVVVEPAGITAATVGSFLGGLDLLIEECDSLDVKVQVREAARSRGIPVFMETSDRGLLDIERFDLEPDRPIFHGLLDDLSADRLAGLSTRDKAPFVLKLLDPAQLSTRLAASMAEIDRTLTTWPQLGGDVVLGAATMAAAVRRFGRAEPLTSGRVRVDLERSLDDVTEPERDLGLEQPSPVVPEPPDDVLGRLADAAHRAPSGGNTQPWSFVAAGDRLELRVRADRTSGMDIGFRGSLVALGAAAFNARTAAAALGQLGPMEVTDEPDLDPDEPVAVLHLGTGSDPALSALYPAVHRRRSNRHPGRPGPLDPELLDGLAVEAAVEGGTVRWVTGPDPLAACAQVLAEADRIRYLTPRLHREMISELRWPERDPLERGIDIRTLELDAADRAKLAVAARADVMATLDAWGAGHGLGDATRDRVVASGALAVVTVPGSTPAHYLQGGATVERLWLAAEQAGLALHPVSPLFLFATDAHDLTDLVSAEHQPGVAALAARFRLLAGVPAGEHLALLLRVSRAAPAVTRSGREPLSAAVRAVSVTS